MFEPVSAWGDSRFDSDMPFTCEQHLCDIVNCPHKTGLEVMKVLDKQFVQKGLNRAECNGGVGDGGGENEGINGIHAIMESEVPSYVRKRCLDHIAWRVADAGVAEMGQHAEHLQAINTYLRDGVTWKRLRAIATQSVASGGLGLLQEGSRDCQALFGKAPPTLVDGRPECYWVFTKWLVPKQTLLAKMVAKDLETRDLKMKQAPVALASLTSRMECVLRHIDVVLLKRSLFLHHWTNAHKHIIHTTDFASLMDKAYKMITSVAVDSQYLELADLTWVELHDVGWSSQTQLPWVHVQVLLIPGMSADEYESVMPDVMAYHTKIATRMATHLQLTAENISRTTWLSAKMLSDNATAAQIGAREFREKLLRTSPNNRNPYEKEFAEDPLKMKELEQFADCQPALRVWRGGGRFQHLFRFLAVRFASSPDHVLDCERVHAQWKWIEITKRSISFKMLNALLKLNHFVNSFGGLPPPGELGPHIEHIRHGTHRQLQTLRASGEVAPSMQADWIYRHRFNMSSLDVCLLKGRTATIETLPRTATVAWGFYLRSLFEPKYFYNFSALSNTMFLYIAENKSMPGRDAPKEGECVGRSLSAAWFEKLEDSLAGICVRPVDGGISGELPLLLATVAEIARAAGDYPDVDGNATARDIEILLESRLLQHRVIRFQTVQRSGNEDAPWDFTIQDGDDVEQAYIGPKNPRDLTKIALARQIQLRDDLSDAERGLLWQAKKDVVLAAYDNPPGVVGAAAAPAPPVAPGPCRGRGRGRHVRGRG